MNSYFVAGSYLPYLMVYSVTLKVSMRCLLLFHVPDCFLLCPDDGCFTAEICRLEFNYKNLLYYSDTSANE